MFEQIITAQSRLVPAAYAPHPRHLPTQEPQLQGGYRGGCEEIDSYADVLIKIIDDLQTVTEGFSLHNKQ